MTRLTGVEASIAEKLFLLLVVTSCLLGFRISGWPGEAPVEHSPPSWLVLGTVVACSESFFDSDKSSTDACGDG